MTSKFAWCVFFEQNPIHGWRNQRVVEECKDSYPHLSTPKFVAWSPIGDWYRSETKLLGGAKGQHGRVSWFTCRSLIPKSRDFLPEFQSMWIPSHFRSPKEFSGFEYATRGHDFTISHGFLDFPRLSFHLLLRGRWLDQFLSGNVYLFLVGLMTWSDTVDRCGMNATCWDDYYDVWLYDALVIESSNIQVSVAHLYLQVFAEYRFRTSHFGFIETSFKTSIFFHTVFFKLVSVGRGGCQPISSLTSTFPHVWVTRGIQLSAAFWTRKNRE